MTLTLHVGNAPRASDGYAFAVMAAKDSPAAGRLRAALGYRWTPDLALGVALFAFAFASYNATLTPSLSYASPDGGEIVTQPYRLGLLHPTGYPFYTWLGKLFTFIPVGDVAHRMNLLSAAGAAASASLVYVTLRLLTGSRAAAAFGGLLWGISTALWSQAVIAEVYAPNVGMLALVLLLAVAWAARERSAPGRPADALFLALCLVYGLSLGVHMSNLAFAPALGLYAVAVNWRILTRPGFVAAAGATFALGVLQFLWLPVKASDVNDPLILRASPATADGFLNYTVNAFSRLRWAFPLEALPDRFGMYLELAKDNLGRGGLLLAALGAVEMARLRWREFLLLASGYAVELAYFLEYRVFDIDVFFIPAHLVLALFAGFGAWRLLTFARWLASFAPRLQMLPAFASAGLAVALFLPLGGVYRDHREENDRSADTVVNDFYENVFEVLPPGSSLVGLTGVIGADMFYFRLVEDRRPDVDMPLLHDPGKTSGPRPGRELFTTWMPQQFGRANPWAPPAAVFPRDAWFVPMLAAPSSPTGGLPFQRPLTLYRVSGEAPPGMIVVDPRPETRLDEWLLDVRLVGVDLPHEPVDAGGRAHLRLYWSFTRAGVYTVTTRVGESEFTETHWATFGQLPRYIREVGGPPLGADWASVEEYDLIIPFSQPAGEQELTVTVDRYGPNGERESASVVVGTIEVVR